ncbi:MAG TPA: SoxR reducing system RseC family protein [Lentimicrobium sp.]|jgi:sigma-E factor negative regulatory protein RseC|nr:SoxR reducing system RseC family protein [Lentimicrobium sp.]
MSNPECIAKTGVVQSVDRDRILVRILAESACSACHAKGACTASDTSEKLIEVNPADAGEVKPGQVVTVNMAASAGNRALFFGYILPFIAVFLTLLIFSTLTSEAVAGALSLAILIPYYLILFLLRKRMASRFRFSITT